MKHRISLLLFAALTASACAHRSDVQVQAPAAAGAPKLLVIVVVDQLRAQHLDDYRAQFTKGIKRLLDQGAWYRRGAYPYLNTVTCVGHATIGTGTFPYRHGMILNAWYDRETKRSPTCTEDPSSKEFSYSGLAPVEGDSAVRLMQPTLADRIHESKKGRVVALSLKPRSTMPVVGKSADALAWFDDRGGWMTSLAYGPPSPALQAYIKAHPLEADLQKVWTKSLPESAYKFADDAPEEHPVAGWDRAFPHPLAPEGKADAGFYTRWQRSPFADEYLGRMAAGMVDAMRLGKGPGVDLLSISFSTLDGVGHAYGPRSHEVQDVLVRLDATIGRLLDHLDATVGRNGYLLGLSADHGVSDIPEQTPDGGRLTSATIRGALEPVLRGALGAGTHVVASHYTDQYLSAAAAERAKTDATLREALLDALRGLPGVQQAFYGPDLATPDARGASDPVRRAAALSYYPGRSGDLILVPRPHWITSTAATTHGTLNEYDQRVPVIFHGAGVKPGIYDQPASPADLAPTLGAAAGIAMKGADGHVLVLAPATAAR
jgi:predicted AlkP superfamily pyrophosphatase or phosphodiesterase